jgi:hypothetical protein
MATTTHRKRIGVEVALRTGSGDFCAAETPVAEAGKESKAIGAFDAAQPSTMPT